MGAGLSMNLALCGLSKAIWKTIRCQIPWMIWKSFNKSLPISFLERTSPQEIFFARGTIFFWVTKHWLHPLIFQWKRNSTPGLPLLEIRKCRKKVHLSRFLSGQGAGSLNIKYDTALRRFWELQRSNENAKRRQNQQTRSRRVSLAMQKCCKSTWLACFCTRKCKVKSIVKYVHEYCLWVTLVRNEPWISTVQYGHVSLIRDWAKDIVGNTTLYCWRMLQSPMQHGTGNIKPFWGLLEDKLSMM